jgi:hypothetical protein
MDIANTPKDLQWQGERGKKDIIENEERHHLRLRRASY